MNAVIGGIAGGRRLGSGAVTEGGSEERHLDFFGMVGRSRRHNSASCSMRALIFDDRVAKLATLFGAMVMVPLFYVDSPGDFSGPVALTEHGYAVHIVLKQRYAIAAHGDFTCDEDQFICLASNLWNGSLHIATLTFISKSRC